MWIEYSECEQSRGLQTAVTSRSTFKSDCRDPLRWCLVPWARFSMDNKVARTYTRRADFTSGVSVRGVLECWYLRTGQGRQQTHSETGGRRLECLLKGDSSGSARLARHATKNPGMREEGQCLLPSRVGASEENRGGHRGGLDTTALSHGGPSASSAQPSVTTSTDENSGTGDAMREVRTGP